MTDKIYDDGVVREDGIQHGIDDDPHGDAEKGAALGGMGGAVVGGLAGSMTGPVGTVIGAVAGAVAGAAASGAAVAAVDTMDNDNTVTGMGEGVTADTDDRVLADEPVIVTDDRNVVVTPADSTYSDSPDLNVPNNYRGDYEHGDNDLPGVQTGGVTTQGEDTRGMTEKAADAITGDRIDDKTGGRVL
jgi:outer membrane lipoprotein SlyB